MKLERAIRIATRAHEGLLDKGGAPYILHPLRLMLQCEDEVDRLVAVLHDVVEDSPKHSLEWLRRKGLPKEAAAALEALSKRKDEKSDYDAFIDRVAENPRARRVKLLDLRDNMDLSRIPQPTAEDHERVEKYRRAVVRLESAEEK